ncbi:hypothetical protein E2562_011200 [Oryza meyeriana var. granulata]|uniref:Uncharacterized protein n=1 Tax=Oryza meyeriana var. granulata TaxID=110450 RepID=A0A6G1DGM8_9ORYZ|nr:hypothetical protein E2562_011200 [Oryza meyeriana var. granulata]
MGLALSAFGLPGLGSIPTGQVYDQYFKDKTAKFSDFHLAFVEFCKDLNTVLPGQDFDTPSLDQLKDFYEKTWEPLKGDHEKKKVEFVKYINQTVKEATVDDSLFIMAGLAAPAGAIVLKRTGESIPQLKKFRLDLLPNVIFVPLCTLGAIMGATALQMGKKRKQIHS